LTALVQSVVGGAVGAEQKEAAPVAEEAGAMPEDGSEQAPPIKPAGETSEVAGPAKIGFDPYKDASEDEAMGEDMAAEGASEAEMMKKKKMKKGSMPNTSITPLA